MRIAVGVACVALTGCSVLVQKRPKDDYVSAEPVDCTFSKGYAHADVVAAVAIAAGTVITAIATGPDVAAVGGPFAIGYTVSAALGYHWAGECRDARERWIAEGSPDILTNSDEVRLARMRKQFAPHGFFCSSSATNPAGDFCVRDQTECERGRQVSMAEGLSPCVPQATAWCAGDRCAPSADVCAQRTGADCVETK